MISINTSSVKKYKQKKNVSNSKFGLDTHTFFYLYFVLGEVLVSW